MSDALREILAETLGKTGYAFLASRVASEPTFGSAMMAAMSRAYDRGRFDQRVEDDLRSPAGRSHAG